jgi:CRP/FNR family transcriptional regulator
MLNKDVRSRLLAFFYHLAIMNGYDGMAESYTMNNFLTHEDIARLTGSTRQTVTTFINKSEEERLLKISGKKILLPEMKKLHQLVIVT